jgi:glucose/arabinose dehydrogenase
MTLSLTTFSASRRALSLARVALVAAGLLVGSAAWATTLPTGFTQTNIASGLTAPNSFVFLPDGTIFVCQQTGAIRVIDSSGTLLATPFATFTVNSSGERGLLGLALDPNFPTNHFVYVYYTATTPAVHNRVSRVTANGNVMVPGSEVPLLNLDNLGATNHNGGCLRFGADGKLYIAAGENANGANAQNLTNLLGKILRINSDGSIPSDNPFFNDPTPGIRKEIWAYGFRNPWRFTIQPGTGDVFIADVGETTWEEVDIGVSGGNFGWPGREGNHCTGNGTCTGIDDIFEYNHNGSGAAITGGDFYSGHAFPSTFAHVYFYGDSVDSFLRYLVLDSNNAVVSDNAFATAADGPVEIRYHDEAIWYTAINTGQLRRISFPARQPLTGDWDGNNSASIGLYTGKNATFALRNSNSPGAADVFFSFGPANTGRLPLVGDWNGDGTDTPGLYDGATGTFSLRNTNSPGNADVVFSFGAGGLGYTPVVGDWNGDGASTIGLYDPATGVFFLRNSNSAGSADLVFQFGVGGPSVVPVVGDWNGDGTDTIGLYNPSTGVFFLRNSNSAGAADLTFTFGAPNALFVPLSGDWNGDGTETIGLYDRATGVFFLKNTNGNGAADVTFNFGVTGP